jgi:hypothetical protein
LKLDYHQLLSTFAVNFNLRRYNQEYAPLLHKKQNSAAGNRYGAT